MFPYTNLLIVINLLCNRVAIGIIIFCIAFYYTGGFYSIISFTSSLMQGIVSGMSNNLNSTNNCFKSSANVGSYLSCLGNLFSFGSISFPENSNQDSKSNSGSSDKKTNIPLDPKALMKKMNEFHDLFDSQFFPTPYDEDDDGK
ncbi:MAG: hypothetical protein SFT91_03780 [Rickettsiaceae bacterium]|nr:hypothetical protein [Rickettsiaceae bacterium]